mmetsp:Transcript_10830/g.25103  ORF Transcript_10830/g.25103 Transcript_10830/m.25103 type:complete len:372 (+) Transcript_10830:667-1782(+)
MFFARVQSSLLLFHRKRQTNENAGTTKKKLVSGLLDKAVGPDDLDEMNVEDLIKENLDSNNKKLGILSEQRLSAALDEYVSKESRLAMTDATANMLSKQQKKLISKELNSTVEVHEHLEETAREEAPASVPKSAHDDGPPEEVDVAPAKTATRKRGRRDEEPEEEEEASTWAKPSAQKQSAKKPAARPKASSSRRRVREEEDSDREEGIERSAQTSTRSRARPRRTARSTKSSYVEEIEDSDDNDDNDDDDASNAMDSMDDGEDEALVIDEDSEEESHRKRGRTKTTTGRARRTGHKETPKLSQSRLSQTSHKTTQSTRSRYSAKAKPRNRGKTNRKRAHDDESDDEDVNFGNSYGVDDDWGAVDTNTERV